MAKKAIEQDVVSIANKIHSLFGKRPYEITKKRDSSLVVIMPFRIPQQSWLNSTIKIFCSWESVNDNLTEVDFSYILPGRFFQRLLLVFTVFACIVISLAFFLIHNTDNLLLAAIPLIPLILWLALYVAPIVHKAEALEKRIEQDFWSWVTQGASSYFTMDIKTATSEGALKFVENMLWFLAICVVVIFTLVLLPLSSTSPIEWGLGYLIVTLLALLIVGIAIYVIWSRATKLPYRYQWKSIMVIEYWVWGLIVASPLLLMWIYPRLIDAISKVLSITLGLGPDFLNSPWVYLGQGLFACLLLILEIGILFRSKQGVKMNLAEHEIAMKRELTESKDYRVRDKEIFQLTIIISFLIITALSYLAIYYVFRNSNGLVAAIRSNDSFTPLWHFLFHAGTFPSSTWQVAFGLFLFASLIFPVLITLLFHFWTSIRREMDFIRLTNSEELPPQLKIFPYIDIVRHEVKDLIRANKLWFRPIVTGRMPVSIQRVGLFHRDFLVEMTYEFCALAGKEETSEKFRAGILHECGHANSIALSPIFRIFSWVVFWAPAFMRLVIDTLEEEHKADDFCIQVMGYSNALLNFLHWQNRSMPLKFSGENPAAVKSESVVISTSLSKILRQGWPEYYHPYMVDRINRIKRLYVGQLK